MTRKRKQRKGRSRSMRDTRQRTRWVVGTGIAVLVLAIAVFVFSGLGTQDPVQVSEQQGAADTALASLPIDPSIGAVAPDFTLSDTSGNPVSLSDFRGKPTIVTFFHTW